MRVCRTKTTAGRATLWPLQKLVGEMKPHASPGHTTKVGFPHAAESLKIEFGLVTRRQMLYVFKSAMLQQSHRGNKTPVTDGSFTVVIVEDDPSVLRSLRRLVRSAGFHSANIR